MPSASADAADALEHRAAGQIGLLQGQGLDEVSAPVAAMRAVVSVVDVSGRRAVTVKTRARSPRATRRSRPGRMMRHGVHGLDAAQGARTSRRNRSHKAGMCRHRFAQTSHAKNCPGKTTLQRLETRHGMHRERVDQEKAGAVAVMAAVDATIAAVTTNGGHGGSQRRGLKHSPLSIQQLPSLAGNTAVGVIRPNAFVTIKLARTHPGRVTMAQTRGLRTTCRRSCAGR